MPNGEGYWISPGGDAVSIRDHFEEVRANPEAFGFSPEEASEWKRADREKVLLEAVRHGWIRSREHRGFITFDVPALTSDTAAAIKEHLERTGAFENETVHVHEVIPKRSFDETAGFFLREEHLALLGQRDGEDGRRMRVRRLPPDVSTLVYDRDVLDDEEFEPEGPAEVVRGEPVEDADLGAYVRVRREKEPAAASATAIVGLTSGFGRSERFSAKAVRLEALKDFPEGGTITLNLGWYRGEPERSVRILVENRGMGLDEGEFFERFVRMAERIGTKFRQEEVPVTLYRGTEKVDGLTLQWRKE